MKFKFKGLTKFSFTVVAVVSFFLSGCLSDDIDYAPMQIAYVSFYHASPDAGQLDVIPGNNPRLNNLPFKYGDYSGYKAFSAGNWKLKFTNANISSAVVLDTTLTFQTEKVYSVFIADSLESIETVVLGDSSSVPQTGEAMIRFVHLSPDAPEVDVFIENEDVASNLLFKEGTAYFATDAEDVELEFRRSEGDNEVLLNIPSMEFENGKYYTIILQGFVNPPTGNTNELTAKKISN